MGTDRCAYCSKLRSVDPVPKVIFALMTMPICLASNHVLVGVVTCVVLSLCNLCLGGQKPRALMGYLKVPAAFLLVGCLTIVLRPVGEQEAIWSVVLLGRFRWGITQEYLYQGLLVMSKAMGSISSMYFLSMNTPMTDLTMGLERMRVPKLLVELMELIYRFIFILSEEAKSIRIAQESRLGYYGVKGSMRALGELASTLFHRALKRGERVYVALESRGYTGTLTTLPDHYQRGTWLYGLGVVVCGMQVVLVLINGRGIL